MEYGVVQRVASVYGTVYFNDLKSGNVGVSIGAGNGYLLQVVHGNVYPTIRNPVHDRPRRDGGIVRKFWKGAKFIEFEGTIIADNPIKRQTLVDHLLGVLDPLLELSGAYYWTPPGAIERSHTVFLFEPASVLSQSESPAAPKTFSFILIAGNTDTEVG